MKKMSIKVNYLINKISLNLSTDDQNVFSKVFNLWISGPIQKGETLQSLLPFNLISQIDKTELEDLVLICEALNYIGTLELYRDEYNKLLNHVNNLKLI